MCVNAYMYMYALDCMYLDLVATETLPHPQDDEGGRKYQEVDLLHFLPHNVCHHHIRNNPIIIIVHVNITSPLGVEHLEHMSCLRVHHFPTYTAYARCLAHSLLTQTARKPVLIIKLALTK